MEYDLSFTAKQIFTNKLGYRNDGYGDGSIRLVEEIIQYEVEELGNLDILSTCERLYKVTDINCLLEQRFNREENVFAIWLTTPEGVVKNYSEEEVQISEYQLPEDALILSDLDSEGILIATQHNPKSMFSQIVST